jgi:transposase InsO family protein
VSIRSDNGLAFVAKVVQLMVQGLGITWKLHMAYHPHSSRKIECMNRVLKLQLGKLCQETHLQWDTYNITTYSTIKDYVKLHEVDRAFTL